MSSVRKTETIPQWKQEEVDELVDFIESFNSVGIVGVAGIPSRQLQAMRRELHGSADVRMSRNTLTVRALEEVNDGVEELTQYVAGQVALIGTNDNPFGLFRSSWKPRRPRPINAGEVAPNDVVIPEGDTGVDPGPFVGELQTVGAAARIQDGSIMVTEDSKVLEEGEVVDDDLANVLTELGIEPKEVGLDLKGVYSEGVLFEPDELEIDVDEYEADIRSAAAAARNLGQRRVPDGRHRRHPSREGVRRGQVRRTVRGDREPGRRARPHREGRRPAPLARGPDRRRGGASRGSCRASKLPRP